ncbi:hypothetical protein ACVNIS_07485 [Sphaerotilaceae bacterium SBD11-9]
MSTERVLGLSAALLAGVVAGRMTVGEPQATPAVESVHVAAAPVAVPVACTPAPQPVAAEEDRADLAGAQPQPGEPQRNELQAAQDALARESDPQRKSELIREIVARKSQDDLGGAWTWLLQHRSDPGYAENARNLLYQWSYARPEHVAALLPQVQSGEAQTAAAQQLAQLWNKKDPHAYQAWVASLPDGSLKAAARSPY